MLRSVAFALASISRVVFDIQRSATTIAADNVAAFHDRKVRDVNDHEINQILSEAENKSSLVVSR